MRIIAVLGISGVGKSTLIEKASKHESLLHLKASDLIKARLAHPRSSEELRQGPVIDHQALMLAEFRERLARTDCKAIVFDGHNLIDTPDGLVEIPQSVFEAISPNCIVFVEDAPENIMARRSADSRRTRPLRSEADLDQYQAFAKVRAAHFAKCLNVPLITLAPDDISGLVAQLN